MKTIKLSQGKKALVDDCDYEWLNKYKWHVKKTGRTFYARRNSSIKNGKRYPIYMHREILNLKDSNIFSDHKDHNGLNNQRNNLRISDYKTNNFNAIKHKDSTTGYRGVYYNKRTNSFSARIRANGKQYSLKYHKTKELAALAYNEAAIKLHGEYASLNILP